MARSMVIAMDDVEEGVLMDVRDYERNSALVNSLKIGMHVKWDCMRDAQYGYALSVAGGSGYIYDITESHIILHHSFYLEAIRKNHVAHLNVQVCEPTEDEEELRGPYVSKRKEDVKTYVSIGKGEFGEWYVWKYFYGRGAEIALERGHWRCLDSRCDTQNQEEIDHCHECGRDRNGAMPQPLKLTFWPCEYCHTDNRRDRQTCRRCGGPTSIKVYYLGPISTLKDSREKLDINTEKVSNAKSPNLEVKSECVCCLDGPQTCAFVHSNGVSHLCVCLVCMEQIDTSTKKCPVCNESYMIATRFFSA
jgi:hypothetical protein